MILVDTSVWIDHLRSGNLTLAHRLDRRAVLVHPWVIGEVALGNLRDRAQILGLLDALPKAIQATDGEVLALIESADLYGSGIGYVDAQLLAAARLTPETTLWTEDRRLESVATQLGLAFRPDPE